MTDITRREVLKSGIILPILPLLPKLSEEEKYKTVYKFTTANLKSYLSDFGPALQEVKEKYTIQYKIGERISPKNGKIFAFSDLSSMKTWVNRCVITRGIEVRFFKCHGYDVIYNPRVQTTINILCIDTFWKYFDKNNIDHTPYFLLTKSNYTETKSNFVFCDSIKLIEELEI